MKKQNRITQTLSRFNVQPGDKLRFQHSLGERMEAIYDDRETWGTGWNKVFVHKLLIFWPGEKTPRPGYLYDEQLERQCWFA